MKSTRLPDFCNVTNIEQWLLTTTLIIRVIPGEEWSLTNKAGRYTIKRILPVRPEPEQHTSRNLKELLLFFLLRGGQYEVPERPSNIIPFKLRTAPDDRSEAE